MHEMGVVMEVVRVVQDYALGNGLSRVASVTLQIGELSAMVPRYVEACFPAAAQGTMLRDAELRIEVLPGNAVCKACGKVHRLLDAAEGCPSCGSRDREALGGKEFLVKEIEAG